LAVLLKALSQVPKGKKEWEYTPQDQRHSSKRFVARLETFAISNFYCNIYTWI
jgi:hypothetical protein